MRGRVVSSRRPGLAVRPRGDTFLRAVPLYEYIAADAEKGCPICRKGFELRRPVDRPALECCPLCKQPVRKKIGRISTPKIAKPFSIVDAKKAGFTVLERRDEGVYERK